MSLLLRKLNSTIRVLKISFDDVDAPCDFAETNALTSEYSGLGVNFSGPGGKDGGAILNERLF